MERLLLLWDEWDDCTAACRHVASCTVAEVTAVSAPLIAAITSFALWLIPGRGAP